MVGKIFGACENQYVNCAEHAVRTGTLEQRVAQDMAPLDGFKQAVAKVIVKDGTAYPDSNTGWGDTRGLSDYKATLHVRDNCEVAKVENYTENYTWHLYDTFNDEAKTGIKADITCVCGEVFRVPFIVEPDGFGSMMERIMNS